MVDVGCERPAHLGNAALGDPPVDGHLPEPQVRVDEAQGEGGIVVVLGLDERDLVLVPPHLHLARKRQTACRERRQPIVDGRLLQQRLEQRAAGKQPAQGKGDEKPHADHRDCWVRELVSIPILSPI